VVVTLKQENSSPSGQIQFDYLHRRAATKMFAAVALYVGPCVNASVVVKKNNHDNYNFINSFFFARFYLAKNDGECLHMQW
jgi:hypothetical protein